MDDEARALQSFFIVELGTDKIGVTHGVDNDGDAFLINACVIFRAGFLESEAILEARAAAAGDEHAQFEFRITLFFYKAFYLIEGIVGNE